MPFFTAIGQQVGAVTDTGTGGTGLLRINPEQVDGAITVFRNALEAVEDEVRWARQEILAQPPASDAVSTDAASAFNRVGLENADSAVAAWEGAIDQLRSVVEQLEAAKQTILNTDSRNTANFQVPS